MNASSVASLLRTPADYAPDTTIRGPWVIVVRVAWVLVAGLGLATFFFSLGPFFAEGGSPLGLAPDALVRLAVSNPGLPIFFAITNVTLVVVCTLTAAFVFWRKSDDWMALVVSLTLLTAWAFLAPSIYLLRLVRPEWQPAVDLLFVLAGTNVFLFFWLFPDGRFVPWWTRWLLWVWGVWIAAYLLSPPQAFDTSQWPTALQVVTSLLFWWAEPFLQQAYQLFRVAGLGLMVLFGVGFSVFAQIHRFTHISNPTQRQQTKLVVLGVSLATLVLIVFSALFFAVPALRTDLRTVLIGYSAAFIVTLLAPISVAVSMLHFRLWDVDELVQRALVYGFLTGLLGVAVLANVFLVQSLLRFLTGPQSDFVLILTALGTFALVAPVQKRFQNLIDRRFFREKVDFRKAFTDFSRQVRTIIDLPELLHILATLMTDILHITHGAIFLLEGETHFHLAHAHNMAEGEVAQLTLLPSALHRLRLGQTVEQAAQDNATFPLLVPLIAPKTGGSELVGVMALGPRLSGQGYSREDHALLTGLADQAGTAIYVARLIAEREVEARKREEAEERLEAYRASPLGRAEVMAEGLLKNPETALIDLYHLAQTAGQNPDAASLLSNLPKVLDSLSASGKSEALFTAGFANGYSYLFSSQFTPELLPLGLRHLIAHLDSREAENVQGAARALTLYRLAQEALQANSIPRITELLPRLREQAETGAEFLAGLAHDFGELRVAAEALHAYERVDTAQDKLAYLTSAIERLTRTEREARTELGSADLPVIWHIAESWLAIVSGTMSELQARAQIVSRLLTRHTWQGEVITLALSLRNAGRGAALHLKVSLQPAPEYTVLDEGATVDRLAPGDEAQVELRVRPRLEQGVSQFRARFMILYEDPRGPDQVENFADAVYLLTAEGEFQYIRNPYVVGTPLPTGSPLFFGRDDVVAFIQENLAAAHRNNLVLIGQRRTGKTSLLKQLPAKLGEDYLPIYLDGQSLGLDPGLPNFFLTLATEMAFALEDRGFTIAPPELSDFADSPATAFERKFLTRVRETIGERHLLILLDEFEEMEAAVRRGNLDASVFGFLRHLIQHTTDLSVIFCGTHRLEELAADYWNVLFNISLYRHVGFLEHTEALRLIQEPVAPFGMKYDDLALDKMWRVSAGHPYFLQLLCHNLVNQHNKTERNYVTVADVNAALEDILASGEAHFVFLWAESTLNEKLVLTALSRMIPLAGSATPLEVVDYLTERGVSVERQALSGALHHLALRDILTTSRERDGAAGDAYRWQLGLLGLWVEKYRSLSRVIEEFNNG